MKIVVHAGGIGFASIDGDRLPYEIHVADMITFMIDEGSLLVSLYNDGELDDPFMWATYAPRTWTQVRLIERPPGAIIEKSQRTRIARQYQERLLLNEVMEELDKNEQHGTRAATLTPHI